MKDLIIGAGIVGLLYIIAHTQKVTHTQTTTNQNINAGRQIPASSTAIISGGAGLDVPVILQPNVNTPIAYQPSNFNIFDWLEAYAYSTAPSYREQYPIAPEVITIQQ